MMMIVALLGAALFAATFAVDRADASTRGDLNRAIRSVHGASGVYVYDITDGRRLASKRSATKRILASNAKLYTAAAALERYGTDGRFSTTLWTDGKIANGALRGNLYLRGGGDPLFGSTDFVKRYYGSRATVEQLALKAKLVGLSRVTGRVYADESAFDRRRGTSTYRYRRSGEIGGQLSALIFNKGFTHGSWQSDPPRHAAVRARSALRAAGVHMRGGTGVRETPVGARIVASIESLPVSALVRQMDKPSNNYLAEMLIKGLAMPTDGSTADLQIGSPPGSNVRPATTRNGARVARRFAASLGSRVSLADGSGLSRRDRAAPREVVDLIRGMVPRASFGPFQISLPIPGVDGTLKRRMRGTGAAKRCSAKTGTLSNVSTLSGLCRTAGGHQVAFSILQNRVWPYGAHSAQDRVVTTIANLR